jgi:hypothetical protein
MNMAKRILLGLLILAAVAGVVSAQEAKMAIGLDLFPLAKGIIWSDKDEENSMTAFAPSFEYLISPRLTLGATADIYVGTYRDIDIFYFGLAAHGRWYPQSSGLDKLFIDAGLGFNRFTVDGEKADPEHFGFIGLTISLKIGYKLLFNKFFVEPSMAFVYAKKPIDDISVPVTPLGWQPGLSIGVAF